MRIGIDLDNVVVNTTESVIEYLNERVPGLSLKMEDLKSYWLEENAPKEYSKIIKEAFESKYMWKKVKLIKGAKKYIKKLKNDGHEIYFVTSSLPNNLYKKINHLIRKLDFFEDDYILTHTINIRYKQLLQLEVLIDDCLNNLIGKRTYKSICFAYPWNVGRGHYEINYCNNWEEIYDTVNKIKGEVYND